MLTVGILNFKIQYSTLNMFDQQRLLGNFGPPIDLKLYSLVKNLRFKQSGTIFRSQSFNHCNFVSLNIF